MPKTCHLRWAGCDCAGRHTGIGRGFVKHLSEETITLTLDKPLRRAFGPEAQNSNASSLGEARNSSAPPVDGHGMSQQHSWRLDKDDVASVFVRLRRNLMGESQVNNPEHIARGQMYLLSAQPFHIWQDSNDRQAQGMYRGAF